MKKILLIGWKDLTLLFRDRAALIMILLAPFALTLGMAFVTGRLSSANSSGPSAIPVVLVNQDGGQLGNALVELFTSKDLAALIHPITSADPALARQQVDEDKAAAAVIIPAGFTRSIIPAPGETAPGPQVTIELVTNPLRPTSSGLVSSIVAAFLNQVEIGRVSGTVAVTQLLASGRISAQQAAQVGAEIGAGQSAAPSSSAVTLRTTTAAGEPVKFDVMALMAPGMALMFLMFATSNGGRTLLAERAQGTLPRLLVSPTPAAQVLGGKVFGIFLSGVAQMLILILTSTLLFSLDWGDPLAVLALVLAAAFGATGWGLLITAVARTPGQVSGLGSAIMLTFGILGGTFIDLANLPGWFQAVSKITPNAWGLEGFTTLALGGRLADIAQPLAALLVMGAALFGLAVLLLGRRGFTQP